MITKVYEFISKDSLCKNFQKELGSPEGNADLMKVNEIICREPFIDAEWVIRCKDCKHWWKENELCTHKKTMNGSVCCLQAKPDFYCGYAEKRKDGISHERSKKHS